MRTIAALILGLILTTGASAQSREETIAETSRRIAEMQREFMVVYQPTASQAITALAVQAALTTALALRDSLASNPYVRVSSFSVGFPAGVSVELSFPPAE